MNRLTFAGVKERRVAVAGGVALASPKWRRQVTGSAVAGPDGGRGGATAGAQDRRRAGGTANTWMSRDRRGCPRCCSWGTPPAPPQPAVGRAAPPPGCRPWPAGRRAPL